MLLGANRVGLGPVGAPPASEHASFERGLAEKIAKLRHEVSTLHADALSELQAENAALKSRLSQLESGAVAPSGARKASSGGGDGSIDFEHMLAAVAEEADSTRKESPAVAAARVVAEEQKAARRESEEAQRRAEEAVAKRAMEEASAAKVAKEAEDALREAEQKAKKRAEEAASRRRAEEAAAAKEAAASKTASGKQRKGGIDPLTGLPVDDSPAGAGDEIEVVVRHAMDDVEARLLVPAAANFLDLKHAIAAHMGSDEVLKKGRLVRRRDGKYAAFKDDEAIGNTTEVLLIGATLVAKSAEARASPHERKAVPPTGSSPPSRKPAFSARVGASPPKKTQDEDRPGRYRIVCDSIVKEGPSRKSGNLGELEEGEVVQVLEVKDMTSESRLRARIDRGAGQSGWITLVNTEDGSRLAARISDGSNSNGFDFDDMPDF